MSWPGLMKNIKKKREEDNLSFKVLTDKIDRQEIISETRLTAAQMKIKSERDKQLSDIITRKDDRFLVIIGPCSAHDSDAVRDYAHRLAKLQDRVKDKLFLIPRVYTNKPRTNGEGYKGMMYQPNPHDMPDIKAGLKSIRELHGRIIGETGLTTADEMLYPDNHEFVDDLISYVAVGARSVENQQHRFVASGIGMPVGMKNPTSGDINVLFNSLHAAQSKHIFLYNNTEVETSSNPLAHVVLRGAVDKFGRNLPNYHYDDLVNTIEKYKQCGLKNPFIVIDTNHDNSGKKYIEQIRIVKEVLFNRTWSDDIKYYVKGFMIESFIEEGKQDVSGEVYGKSITDPCLGWEQTERLVEYIAENV